MNESELMAQLYSRSLSGHRPGSKHTVGGTAYIVGPRGEWRRVNPATTILDCVIAARSHNNSKRRRACR